MKLYYSDFLSGRKACAMAGYLKSPVEFIYLDFVKGDQKGAAHLAHNPNAKMPTLVEKDRTTWEADAVMCRLSQIAGADLWPSDPALQIEVIRWFSWNSAHFGRAGGSLYFENIVRRRLGFGQPDKASVEEGLADFRRYAAVLDQHLADRKWALGDKVSVVDFSLGVTLPYAADAQIPLNDFPRVRRWHDQLNAFDAWRSPFPARPN